jgi:hypothetical protein
MSLLGIECPRGKIVTRGGFGGPSSSFASRRCLFEEASVGPRFGSTASVRGDDMAATLSSGAQAPSSDGAPRFRAPKVTLPLSVRAGTLRRICEKFAANPVSEHLNNVLRTWVTNACTRVGCAKIIRSMKAGLSVAVEADNGFPPPELLLNYFHANPGNSGKLRRS